MCIYCKITGDQVEGASNKKAKEHIKAKDRKDVYYSTTMPKDVNRTHLMLLTILLGFFGAGNYYVGKYAKGAYCTASWIVFLPFVISNSVFGGGLYAIKLLSEITAVLVMFNLLMWIADIFSLIAKTYKVPVVLGEKKKK